MGAQRLLTTQAVCEWTPKGSSAGTDAYLAAFALASNLSVVTFDGGMNRFPGLNVELPRKKRFLADATATVS